MAGFDEKTKILQKIALNIQAIISDTTTAGTEIDTQTFEALTFIIQAGTLSDGTYTPLIQHSDTSGSGYTDVADADLIGTEAGAALDTSNTTSRIGYVGKKRYVKLSVVSASTSSGGTLGALAILGRPFKMETAAS